MGTPFLVTTESNLYPLEIVRDRHTDINTRDIYYTTWGPGYFYEKQEAFDAYDARLSYILNYKGATSGQVWKEWSDAIVGFNVQVRVSYSTRFVQGSSLPVLIATILAERADDSQAVRMHRR